MLSKRIACDAKFEPALSKPCTKSTGSRGGFFDAFAPGAQIQTEGQITHGHLPENNNHGGGDSQPLSRKFGKIVNRIAISNFVYKPGDLAGVPACAVD